MSLGLRIRGETAPYRALWMISPSSTTPTAIANTNHGERFTGALAGLPELVRLSRVRPPIRTEHFGNDDAGRCLEHIRDRAERRNAHGDITSRHIAEIGDGFGIETNLCGDVRDAVDANPDRVAVQHQIPLGISAVQVQYSSTTRTGLPPLYAVQDKIWPTTVPAGSVVQSSVTSLG